MRIRASIYLLILTVIPGCAREDIPVYQVDPRLEKYIDRFLFEGEQRGKTFTKRNLILTATVDLLANEGRMAVSRSTSSDQVIIEVDESLVASHDTLFLEFAIMHEFGHGFLKRGHVNTVSVMNPSRKSVDAYKRNERERSKLLDELFR